MILGCGWKRLRSVAGRQEVTYRYRQPGTCTTNILNFPSASNKTTIPSYHVSLSTTNSPKMPAYIVSNMAKSSTFVCRYSY
ncbi:uncharacterized protein TrAFT101_001365 [Trichoderma asperellum]|uniref:uncharacterized protein n=1 Tax=Trichoderma asperellum TaxID=101201 RepID=UPI0033287E00|nr:hypothetical protein TrAFT101_001365 [Trichoderma asperellum]